MITSKEPDAVTAAPINPPMRVWEELDGIPSHQVNRFQVMAATNPHKITFSVMNCSNTELATELATLNSPMIYLAIKKAAKLNTAAQSTA